MFSSDVVVPQLACLFERKLKNAFGPGREGDFNGDESRSAADDLLNFDSSVLEVDTHGLEDLGGNTCTLSDQTEQDLLSADKIVAEATCLLLGQHDHLDGLLGKPLEHRQGRKQISLIYQGWRRSVVALFGCPHPLEQKGSLQ